MLAKLSEALFVDTLWGRYVAGLPEQQTGWLAGTRDPTAEKPWIADSRVAHPWTIADLADQVAVRTCGTLYAIPLRTAHDLTLRPTGRLQWPRGRTHCEVSRTSPLMSDTNRKRHSIAHSKREFGGLQADTAAIIRISPVKMTSESLERKNQHTR